MNPKLAESTYYYLGSLDLVKWLMKVIKCEETDFLCFYKTMFIVSLCF